MLSGKGEKTNKSRPTLHGVRRTEEKGNVRRHALLARDFPQQETCCGEKVMNIMLAFSLLSFFPRRSSECHYKVGKRNYVDVYD